MIQKFLNNVIGIDRDGVINRDLFTYCFRPLDFDPIPNSLEAIALLKNLGYKIVIITNQGGIEKNLYSHDDVFNTHTYMLDLLKKIGCEKIDAIYYSPSSQKDNEFAKPNIGMFELCEREHPDIKFYQGYFVGDKMSDLEAAIKIKAIPVLVRTGYGLETEKKLNDIKYLEIKQRVIVFDTLWDFAKYIEAQA